MTRRPTKCGARDPFFGTLDGVLHTAAASRNRADQLAEDAIRKDRLAAAADLAKELSRMADLIDEAADRLQALRARSRSRQAYGQASALRRSVSPERPVPPTTPGDWI